MLAPVTVMTGLVFHQIAYFAERGLSAELAAPVPSVYALAFAGMTFLAGFVLERVPERFVLIAGLLLPVTVIWLMTVTTLFPATVYGVLLGVVLGTIRGVTQAAVVASAATGPLMLSVPHDLAGSFGPGLWLMVAFPLTCAVAHCLPARPRLHPTPGLTAPPDWSPQSSWYLPRPAPAVGVAAGRVSVRALFSPDLCQI